MEEEEVRSVEASMVTMTKLVLSSHLYPGTPHLAGGVLLKWMDTVACLSAELHAHSPCVTVSVDDLQLEADPELGSIVFLTARVNRAFNTSMEVGVIVESETANGGERVHVCRVFATFVEKRVDCVKRKLPPIVPLTFDEKTEYYLASERRKHRLNYTKKMGYAVAGEFHKASESHTSAAEVCPSESILTSTELVLPPHANHHQNTFGGQIMEWIEQLAYIIARKVCSTEPLLVAVDEIHFQSASTVSDRIHMKGCVNYTWGSTLEIGVCVEAYRVGEEKRHCNSAFLTYKCSSPVPRLRVETVVEERRARKALLRRAIRYERRAIRSECKAYAQPWSQLNAPLHSASNISNLRKLYQLTDEWEYLATVDTANKENQIIVNSAEVDKTMCFRAETTFPFSAKFIYSVIKDIANRHQWDPNCESLEIIDILEDDDILFKIKLNGPSGAIPGPLFRLLCSAREPDQSTGAYTVAFTSVLPSEQDEKSTAEVRASGFIIKPVHSRLARRMTTLDKKRSFRRRKVSDSGNEEGRRSLERSMSGRRSLERSLSQCSTASTDYRSLSETSSSESEETSSPKTFQACVRRVMRRESRVAESHSCIVTYIMHTTETMMPYIARDLAGFGVVGVSMVKSLNEFLQKTMDELNESNKRLNEVS